MSYSLDPLQTECYPGTSVLVNKQNIQDERILAQVEADITKLRISQWSLRLLADRTVELGYIDSISHVTISTILKKTNLSLI